MQHKGGDGSGIYFTMNQNQIFNMGMKEKMLKKVDLKDSRELIEMKEKKSVKEECLKDSKESKQNQIFNLEMKEKMLMKVECLKDSKELRNEFKFALENDAFESVKKVFENLVWNDRNGVSSREYFVDEEGNSPLFWACSGGNESLVKMLVEKFLFPVNDQNNEGCTALIVAVLGGFGNIVCYLLEKGANPNVCNLKRESALHMACSLNLTDVCEALLRHGAWIEAEDECGETALYWAVREENIEVTEFLLKNGSNPDHPNEDGDTPREISKLSTSDDLTQLLDSFAGAISFSELDSQVSLKPQPLFPLQTKGGKQKDTSNTKIFHFNQSKEVKCK